MVMDKSLLHDVKLCQPPVTIGVGNKQIIMANECGVLTLAGLKIPCLFAPALSRNLLSVSQTSTISSGRWDFTSNSASLVRGSNKTPIITSKLVENLYVIPLDGRSPITHALHANAPSPFSSWHKRLGHLNVDDVVRLGKAGRLDNEGYWISNEVTEDKNAFQCPSCIMGGGKRLPTHLHTPRASHPLETLYVDLFGPTRTLGPRHERYQLTIYDDYSRRYHVVPLVDKRSITVATAMENYINYGETQTGYKCKAIRSDRGSEFLGFPFKSLINKKGLEHLLTSPDSHAQNGRIERAIFTIIYKGSMHEKGIG